MEQQDNQRRWQIIRDSCNAARDELKREVQEMIRLRVFREARIDDAMDVCAQRIGQRAFAMVSEKKISQADENAVVDALNKDASADIFPKRGQAQKVKPSSEASSTT
jgi:hypothetical protein